MARQVNIRAGEATKAKLDWLTGRYGSQTQAVAVAIDRLYQAEKGDPVKFSGMIHDEHFQALAAVFAPGYHSRDWRKQHSHIPFWERTNDLASVMTEQHFAQDRHEFISRFCALLSEVVATDENLAYTDEDLQWFVKQMDEPHALAVASLLLAYASAPEV